MDYSMIERSCAGSTTISRHRTLSGALRAAEARQRAHDRACRPLSCRVETRDESGRLLWWSQLDQAWVDDATGDLA